MSPHPCVLSRSVLVGWFVNAPMEAGLRFGVNRGGTGLLSEEVGLEAVLGLKMSFSWEQKLKKFLEVSGTH